MNKLISRPINRFFAFGCSFTAYGYPGWSEIVAYDLDVEFYNYGRNGAGNQYIFNMIMQADSFFNFTKDDLIIVEWTSVAREDRYKNKNWLTPGNIYTQSTYDKQYVKEWADFDGYAIRDFASIKATVEFLKSKQVQYHCLAMAPLLEIKNQWAPYKDDQISQDIYEVYQYYIDNIAPSFYDVLWDGTVLPKIKQEHNRYSKTINGHPSPSEHFTFLLKTFDHSFLTTTSEAVLHCEQQYNEILDNTDFTKKSFGQLDFTDLYFIRSNPIKKL